MGARKRVAAMDKTEAVIRYRAAMAVFRRWLSEGFISQEELKIICTMTADKYGLSSCSIYREEGLIYIDNYANIR